MLTVETLKMRSYKAHQTVVATQDIISNHVPLSAPFPAPRRPHRPSRTFNPPSYHHPPLRHTTTPLLHFPPTTTRPLSHHITHTILSLRLPRRIPHQCTAIRRHHDPPTLLHDTRARRSHPQDVNLLELYIHCCRMGVDLSGSAVERDTVAFYKSVDGASDISIQHTANRRATQYRRHGERVGFVYENDLSCLDSFSRLSGGTRQ
jgi:hypothetical protein